MLPYYATAGEKAASPSLCGDTRTTCIHSRVSLGPSVLKVLRESPHSPVLGVDTCSGTALEQFATSTPQLGLAPECSLRWLPSHHRWVPSPSSCSFPWLILSCLPVLIQIGFPSFLSSHRRPPCSSSAISRFFPLDLTEESWHHQTMMLSSLALGLWSMFLRVGQLWRLLCLFLFTFPRHAVRHSVLYVPLLECWRLDCGLHSPVFCVCVHCVHHCQSAVLFAHVLS